MRTDAMTHRVLRAAALLVPLALGGCRAGPSTSALDRTTASPEPVLSGPCLRFAGPPGDPDLRGLPRTEPVRCCPSGYGFDPALAQRSCGFAEYLGESEELACVHRFRGDDGAVHELRVTPILDRGFDEVVALHERSAFADEHLGEAPEGLPSLWWSASADRRWAFVPGWSIVRRLGWDEAACDPTRIKPVLAGMLAAPADPAAAVALPRMTAPPKQPRLPGPSLLDRELDDPTPGRRYPLPRAATALVDALLIAALADDRRGLASLLEPGARIGLPDRRQLGARSLLASDDGAAAIELLLTAAARFPAETRLHCPMIDRRARPQIARGEALMWCLWISEDSLDMIVLGLRGRVSAGESDGRVEYVGVFPARPEAPVSVVGEPAAPAVVDAVLRHDLGEHVDDRRAPAGDGIPADPSVEVSGAADGDVLEPELVDLVDQI
jgi:hypothetical protein